MAKKNYQILGVCVLLLLAMSCVKDKPNDSIGNTPSSIGNVYVVCEGSYGSGNSSLYAFKPAKDSVYGDIYKAANNIPLGDVFQSMTKIGNYFFLVINNSGKINVVDASTFKMVRAIPIPEPRYVLAVGNNKAYVSTLYSKDIYVINTQSFTVANKITLPTQNPEGMCLLNGQVVVSSWDTGAGNIYVIDPTTDKIFQTVHTAGLASQEVLVDKNQLLWVLSGNQPEGKTATLSHIDPSTGLILDSFTFDKNINPVKPVFNRTKDTLYFIEADYYGGLNNNGIYRMGIYEKQLPSQAFIPAAKYQYFWALGIDPVTGNIYVGDPLGFTQKGIIYIYNSNGTKLYNFNAGLGPGHFYFDN